MTTTNANPITGEIITANSATLAALNKSEIDQQISTAKAYPRGIKAAMNAALDLATLSEKTAEDCIYALPRDGKVIEGPSARLAEILAHAWGNCRAGARIVEETYEFVTAQGVFHDLETNTVITYEQKRRITGKNGRRYSPDMIATTSNAACSIALRNAILKGIPKAIWQGIYDQARTVAKGDAKTLVNKRADAFKAFAAYGVSEDRILKVLEVDAMEDVGLDQLLVLRGIFTAIKDGEVTPEEAFPTAKPEAVKAPNNLSEFAKGEEPKAETKKAEPEAPKGEAASHEAESIAYERGLQARKKGMSEKAMPPEYRTEDRLNEANSWKSGWDAGAPEKASA